ncbi:MAG: thioredoxin domain-containing protein [Alphaproteobacteria bacterium]
MPNHLAGETSPYLKQHQDNPVDWWPWGEEALSEARKQGKPILLSIGYAACHWCHVMAHESFEDPAIAAQMNEQFICIKVDREERPDLDSLYQQALQLMGQPGGWPLTMFLTAQGAPFWGGTYFPPTDMHGRPGFSTVLDTIASNVAGSPEKVAGNVQAIVDALADLSRPRAGEAVPPTLVTEAATVLTRQSDPFHGGISGAPKFPHPGILQLIWRGYQHTGDTAMRDAVTTALTHMCQGGIYDHLGGGFARYSVDEYWLVPHFEKMLYDNAQLVELMCHVWQETGSELFQRRIAETCDWVLREMLADNAAFAATLDADSEGEEGLFYVWTVEEIEEVLGSEADLFCRFYDITDSGNFEGRNIPNRLQTLDIADGITGKRLADSRARLLQARAQRTRPGRDDKVLADWNGMMIATLARAARLFNRPDWLDAARTAYAAVTRDLSRDKGRLWHSWCAGRAAHPATLDDYAQMIRAALTLHEITASPDYLDHALNWEQVLEQDYRDEKGGGFFLTASDTADILIRLKDCRDSATPAGNAIMVENFARLLHLTGDLSFEAKAKAQITAFSGELKRNIFPLASLLNGADFLSRSSLLITTGPDRTPLEAAASSLNGLNLIWMSPPEDTALPEDHPATGKLSPDRATAYHCRATTCEAPLHDPDALSNLVI